MLRTGGVWATVQTPTQAQIDTADTILDANGQQMKAAFLGGHVYQVSTTIGNELTAAGYAVTP